MKQKWCAVSQCPKFPRRPGNGWAKYKSAPVWEHSSGLRVHSIGVCRLPDGKTFRGGSHDQYAALWRAIAQQGGNRKRGLMVWALWIAANAEVSNPGVNNQQPKE